MNNKRITLIPVLAGIIFVTGLFKIPTPTGVPFQLSSAVSVMICLLTSSMEYMLAGFLASFLSLIMGGTFYTITISLIFRLGVLIFTYFARDKKVALIFSGFFGSILARIFMSFITNISLKLLIIEAMPGMILSSVICFCFYNKLVKIIGEKINV